MSYWQLLRILCDSLLVKNRQTEADTEGEEQREQFGTLVRARCNFTWEASAVFHCSSAYCCITRLFLRKHFPSKARPTPKRKSYFLRNTCQEPSHHTWNATPKFSKALLEKIMGGAFVPSNSWKNSETKKPSLGHVRTPTQGATQAQACARSHSGSLEIASSVWVQTPSSKKLSI